MITEPGQPVRGPAWRHPRPDRQARDPHRPEHSPPGAQRPEGQVIRAQLPGTLIAPRQVRAVVRKALATWGLTALISDAELLTSEIVANSAEHADGQPIGLTIRRHATTVGQPGIRCEITDTSSRPPRAQPAEPASERGRGLVIVTALATTSGVTTPSARQDDLVHPHHSGPATPRHRARRS